MRQSLLIKISKQIICLILCVIIILPFYMVVINSFKSRGESARMNLGIPTEWFFENYIVVIDQGNLLQGFANSMLYAVVSTLIALIGCAMAAFVLSRNRTKLNTFIYYFVLCGLFFPVNYVTLVRVLQLANISNTRMGLIIAFSSSMIPFGLFVIRNFIGSVPIELDEAAVIDGAGPVRLFFIIIMPLLQPVLVTVFILQFLGVWNDFMTPLYLSSSSSIWPMNLAVYNFFGRMSSYWNLVFADIVLTVLPVLIVYLIGQKYIINGLTSGSVKN